MQQLRVSLLQSGQLSCANVHPILRRQRCDTLAFCQRQREKIDPHQGKQRHHVSASPNSQMSFPTAKIAKNTLLAALGLLQGKTEQYLLLCR